MQLSLENVFLSELFLLIFLGSGVGKTGTGTDTPDCLPILRKWNTGGGKVDIYGENKIHFFQDCLACLLG